MPASNTATNAWIANPALTRHYQVRSAAYGGLVGQGINDLDACLKASDWRGPTSISREDYVHNISVACGYVGLLAGFAAVAAVII